MGAKQSTPSAENATIPNRVADEQLCARSYAFLSIPPSSPPLLATAATPSTLLHPTALLNAITMDAFVSPTGLLGPIIGHHVRCNVGRFDLEYFSFLRGGEASAANDEEGAAKKEGSGRRSVALERVVVDASSVRAANYVTADFAEVAPSSALTQPDGKAISFKVHDRSYNILNTAEFPLITFDVKAEDAASITGDLTLRGVTAPVSCTKAMVMHASPKLPPMSPTDPLMHSFLSIKCPFKQSSFGMVPYAAPLNIIAVSDEVVVEVRVPKELLV